MAGIAGGRWPEALLWAAAAWVGSLLLAALVLVPALLSARSLAADARAAVASRDLTGALDAASSLGPRGAVCRGALWLPAPLTLRVVPGVGPWVRALDEGCGALQDVSAAAAPVPVRALAARLGSPSSLRSLGVDAALVTRGLAALDASAPSVRSGLARLQALDALGLPGDAGARVHAAALRWTPEWFEDVRSLASVAPALLGVDRPRTYLVALESNAEMRATGGFVGQFAIVRAAGGKVRVLRLGTNSELVTPARPGVELLPGTEALTLTDNPMWVNTNLSPHGPDVGALWLYAWRVQTGQRLDGVIGIDITTAARLAAAAGGTIAKPDGTVLASASAIADYAQNGVYFDFDGPDMAGDPRKSYQLAVLRDLLAHASASILNVDSLVRVLPDAISERRVLLRFAAPALQARIAASPVAQSVVDGDLDAVRVTWNNWAGNKFDFYMRVTASGRCLDGGAALTLRVRSTAEAGRTYPAYIGQRLDTPSERRASVRDQFLLVLPAGAEVRGLTVDGRLATHRVSALGPRPVVQLLLDTAAGESHVVRVVLTGAPVASVAVQGARAVALACR